MRNAECPSPQPCGGWRGWTDYEASTAITPALRAAAVFPSRGGSEGRPAGLLFGIGPVNLLRCLTGLLVRQWSGRWTSWCLRFTA